MGVVSREFVDGVNAAQGCTAEVYAVIVSDAEIKTVRQTKGFAESRGLAGQEKFPPYQYRRYKIALQSTPEDTPLQQLPWAIPYFYGPEGSAGYSTLEPRYAAGNLVTVTQHIEPNLSVPTGTYYIVRQVPTTKRLRVATGTDASIAFVNGKLEPFTNPSAQTVSERRTRYRSGVVNPDANLSNVSVPNEADGKFDSAADPIPLPDPKVCRKKVDGINEPLDKLSKKLTEIQQKLVGSWEGDLDDKKSYTTTDPDGNTWGKVEGGAWTQLPSGSTMWDSDDGEANNIQWDSLSSGEGGAPGNLVQKTSSILSTKQAIDGLQEDVQEFAQDIAKTLATGIFKELRKRILRGTTTVINNAAGVAPVAARYAVDKTKLEALDLLSCLLLKMIKNLASMIAKALFKLLEKVINFGICVLETFLAQFVGQLLGQLLKLINAILGPISKLLGSVINFTNQFFGLLQDIISFLKCDPDIACTDVKKWSFIDGPVSPGDTIDLAAVFESATAVSKNFSNVMNIPDNLEDYEFDFNVDQAVDEAVNNCDVGFVDCNTEVVFWSGGGSGASGNPVISAVGDLMGVDIITSGSGYNSPPLISFESICGNGTGAVGEVGIGTVVGVGLTTQILNGVTNVTILESGYGYLPFPDGSKGGNGRTYANRCQTVMKRASGSWDPAYSEGTVLTAYWWDMVQLPGKGEVYIDKDFTIDMLPGWTEYGTKPNLKSMVGFDDCRGTSEINPLNIKSMVGFDDTRGSSSHPDVTPPISDEHAQYVEEFKASLISAGVWDHYRQFDYHNTGYGVPNQFGFVNDYHYARELGYSDKDIRFYLEGYYSQLLGKNIGPLMRAKLDDPDFGTLPPYYTGAGNCGVFDCETDYPYAQSLGFSDQDIRFYLEKQYPGRISDCMQSKLDDPNWGPIPEYYVTGTAPGCPPLPSGPSYDVIASLDDIVTIECGVGYDCVNDTVNIVPSHGAEAVLEQCDENGSVCKLRVTNPGIGFTMLPEITINTNTGYNGRYVPRLKFERPSEVPPGTEVLKVIDCVGKVVNCGC